MADIEFLPPLLLAEELPMAELKASFAARNSTVPSPEFQNDELFRGLWLGGIALDTALHPETDVVVAEDYFEDAAIHWQHVLDHPFVAPSVKVLRLNAQLLLEHLPAFKGRKHHFGSKDPADYLSPEAWDAVDLGSARALERFLDDSDAPQRDKAFESARVGTQLACGRAGILTFPSSMRESMKGAGEAPADLRQLGHHLYGIGETGVKLPMQVRVRRENLRYDAASHILIPFGDLAQTALKRHAPDVAGEDLRRADCSVILARWLIDLAKDADDLPLYQLAAIDQVTDDISDRIDCFEAELLD